MPSIYIVTNCVFRGADFHSKGPLKGSRKLIKPGEELKGRDLEMYEDRLPYFLENGMLKEVAPEAKKAPEVAKPKGKKKKAEAKKVLEDDLDDI